jgi:trehalose 6-phosphate synthase/phosphatase
MSVYREGDIVWVLDYQLLLLPAILRAKAESMTIALYVRSPFPSSELFRCLPRILIPHDS